MFEVRWDFWKKRIKITANQSKQKIRKQHDDLLSSPDSFFSLAHTNISYFNSFAPRDLLRCPSTESFKNHLLAAMFTELTDTWTTLTTARHTFNLLPSWGPQHIPTSTISRHAETIYYQYSFTQNNTRAARHHFNIIDTPDCPNCRVPEDTTHILLQCTLHNNARRKLTATINTYHPDIPPTTQNLLTHPTLKPFTETFICDAFHLTPDEIENRLKSI